MKKFAAVLMALMMTTAMAACGGNTSSGGKEQVASGTSVAGLSLGSQPVELTFWHSMSDENGALLEQLVKQFNDTKGKELNITVNPVYQGKYSDATTKLKAVLTSGDAAALPDVMQMDATAKILYAQSGHAYTLDRLLADHPDFNAASIYESLVNNWTYQNVRLGLPFAASTTVTYYNKTLLDAAGAGAPSTLADIAALKTKLNGKVTNVYTCLPNSASLNNWVQQLGGKLLDQDNGTLGNSSKLTAATDGTLKTFLTEWKALYQSGALENADTTTTDAFVSGQTALMTGSTSSLSSVINKVGSRFEVGVCNFPLVNASAKVGATSSGSALMAFDKGDGLKMLAAWEFMQYLTGAEVQAQWSTGTGYLPVNTGTEQIQSYRDYVAKMPQFTVGVQQLAATPAAFTSVTIGPAADFYYAVQNNVSEMLTKDLSVEDTIANMTGELEGILNQYNQANS